MVVLCLIFLIISLVMTLIYATMWHKNFDVHFTLIFTFIPITIMGYLFYHLADDLNGAVRALQLTYMGGCFLILFIMLSIFSICDIKIARPVRALFYLFNMLVYLSVLSIGKLDLFYKNPVFEDGTIIKEYGFMHSVFVCMVIVYFFLSIIALIYSYFKKKNISNTIIVLLFLPVVFSVCAYFGGKAHSNGDLILVPISYLLSQIDYLLIIYRLSLYNIDDSAYDTLAQEGNTGIFAIDTERRYLGSNETAKVMFPELAELSVDKPLDASPEMNCLISRWIENYQADYDKYKRVHVSKDSKIYLVEISSMFVNKKMRGYQFFLTDDTKDQQYLALLDKFNEKLKKRVEEKTQDLRDMHDRLIMSMAAMVESRDNSTGGHIKRTSVGVKLLTDEMIADKDYDIDPEFVKDVIKAAPMHDLGKIAVPDSILQFNGRYEPWQFEQMKRHAHEGARIVHEILEGTDDERFHHIAENVAHYHHERWDGSGYPDGLKGEEIPLEARIMAIADVYDALVSKRCYKDKMSLEKADSIIMEGMGTQFDKSLEKYYVAARPKLEKYYSELPDEGEPVKEQKHLCDHQI